MKKNLLILAAFLTLGTMSLKAQTEATATCGQTVEITATPDAGWVFVEWQDGNKDNPRLITISDELEVYEYVATFSQSAFTVVAKANDDKMGTVTGGGSYEKGAKVTLKATPASKCYKFVKWSDNVTTAEREITVTDNDEANTYEAIFAEEEFTVKVNTVAGGKVTIAKK